MLVPVRNIRWEDHDGEKVAFLRMPPGYEFVDAVAFEGGRGAGEPGNNGDYLLVTLNAKE